MPCYLHGVQCAARFCNYCVLNASDKKTTRVSHPRDGSQYNDLQFQSSSTHERATAHVVVNPSKLPRPRRRKKLMPCKHRALKTHHLQVCIIRCYAARSSRHLGNFKLSTHPEQCTIHTNIKIARSFKCLLLSKQAIVVQRSRFKRLHREAPAMRDNGIKRE